MPLVTPTESRISELLNEHLEATRDVIQRASALTRECAAHLERTPGKSAAIEAQLSLLPRVADAMSGVALLALSSVVYELGHLSAWIGPDDALARTWLDWHDPQSMPKGWGWQNITKGALARIAWNDAEAAKRHGFFYTRACMAKHGNPLALRNRPSSATAEMALLNSDPLFTPSSGNDSVSAFIIAGTSGLIAVDSFWSSFPAVVSNELILVRNDVAHDWNVFVTACANRPRTPAS